MVAGVTRCSEIPTPANPTSSAILAISISWSVSVNEMDCQKSMVGTLILWPRDRPGAGGPVAMGLSALLAGPSSRRQWTHPRDRGAAPRYRPGWGKGLTRRSHGHGDGQPR